MHILYLHQYFTIPSGTAGTRSYEFARRWVKYGNKVTLITGYCDISGLEKPKSLIEKRNIDGIDIIITGMMYSSKLSFPRRILSFCSFVICCIIAGLRVKNADVIYASSTPLTVGIPAMILKIFKRTPFVFEVRDQWPQIPIELGIIKNPLLKKMLLWLEKSIYKSSSAIVALSPGMEEGIRKVIGSGKEIIIAPNCSDIDIFHPEVEGSNIRNKFGWNEKMVFLHAGAMGKVNNLEFVLDAAKRVSESKNVLFVLIGEGKKKTSLESRVHKENINNVKIMSAVSKYKLPEIFAAADVSMVIIGNFPILEHNSANKFFDSLAAGKPVVLNYSGWQRKVIEDNNAGLGCTLCNLDEFIENIKYLGSHRDRIRIMGKNARKLAEEKFSRDLLVEKVLNVVEKAAE